MRDWLSHRVVSSPDDPALVRAEDGEVWTYADLDRLVAETAGRLAAHGIGEGDHLGVLMPPSVGTVGLVHAAMRLGATFVPLGNRLTPRELADRVAAADVSTLVCARATEADAVDALDAVGAAASPPTSGSVPILSVDDPDDGSVTALHEVGPEPVDPPRWNPDDRLCLLFTSGTTGDPKAVELTAENVYSSAIASAFRLGIDPDDRWLVSLSLHHMGGLAPIYRSTLYGTTVVLRSGFDPGGTADDIDRYDVTGVSLVPTMLSRALDRRGTLADSLRAVLLGGAPAPDALIERCRDYSIPVYPTYGMTEAASQIATATPDQAHDRLGTVGRPLFGTDIAVVDGDGSPVDPGETGEIVVSGPTISPGYYGDPDATAVAFGEYGLHTGDIGRVDEDGYLYVLNRVDDRIITGGENVEPGEVAAVLRDHPDVADAAVVGLDDEVWGERVAALIEVSQRPGASTGGVGGSDAAAAASVDDSDDDSDGDSDDDSDGDIADDAEDADPGGSTGGRTDQNTGERADGETDEGTSEGADGAADTIGDAVGIDDADVIAFARDRLAGFKLPRTIAYTAELPRTVSGTVDRRAVREALIEHGFAPVDPDSGFDEAGFQPADPVSATTPGTGSDGEDPGCDEGDVGDDEDGGHDGAAGADGPAGGTDETGTTGGTTGGTASTDGESSESHGS